LYSINFEKSRNGPQEVVAPAVFALGAHLEDEAAVFNKLQAAALQDVRYLGSYLVNII
jgi:hypothetical protein